jgi:hypothetical protein
MRQIISTKTVSQINTGQPLYADVNGPSTITGDPGISWQNPGGTPPWQVYGILKNILGFATTEIDQNGFERIDNFLFNTGNSFNFSVLVKDPIKATELLRLMASQCDCSIFYGADGVWKMMPHAQYLTLIFPSYNAPVTQFSDSTADYIIQGLDWWIIEPQYKKHKVRYQYDYARNDYFGELTKDDSATVPNGIDAPAYEAQYIRESNTAQELLNRLSAFYRKKRRSVTFNTTLAAAHLELGDYIKVNHAALPDNTPRYQIQAIEYSGATIKITAMEI